MLALGVALLLVGVIPELGETVAIALIVLGAGIFLVGVLLPLVSEFQIGPGGFSAKLRERDREFEAALSAEQLSLSRLGAWLAGDHAEGKRLAEEALRATYLTWRQARGNPSEAVRAQLVALAPEAMAGPASTTGTGTADGPEALLAALSALPKDSRAALVLQLLEGMETEAIGAILGRSSEAARGAVETGLAELGSARAKGKP